MAEQQQIVGEYQQVEVKRYAASTPQETAEGIFWRSFRREETEPLVGNVTTVDFCPVAPFHFAVTSSTRVTVFSGITRQPLRNFSRFKGLAYSGRFRSDGKLLAAGGDRGIVQVFDAVNRTVLRQLKGHTDAVRAVRFADEKVHVMSGGDDSTVQWWDIGSQEALRKMDAHSDYVRCLSANPVSSHLWATGSYDHSVLLWDMRQRDPAMRFQHDHPVEDVLFFPTGTLLAIAGGTSVAVWDLLKGGVTAGAAPPNQQQQQQVQPKPVACLSSHQKTVTCVLVTPPIPLPSSDRIFPSRLLTASLDGHVRAFSLSDYKVKHVARYGEPILSLGLSKNGATLAVGMAEGHLAVRHRQLSRRQERHLALAGAPEPRVPGQRVRRRKGGRRHLLRASNFRYFIRGQTEQDAAEEYLVSQQKRAHLSRHDHLLRTFQYSEALAVALCSAKLTEPEVVVSVVEELVARGGFGVAIARLSTHALSRLFAFARRHITNPRYASFLIPVVHTALDIRAQHIGANHELDRSVDVLREVVAAETRTLQQLAQLQGLIMPLLRASTANAAAVDDDGIAAAD